MSKFQQLELIPQMCDKALFYISDQVTELENLGVKFTRSYAYYDTTRVGELIDYPVGDGKTKYFFKPDHSVLSEVFVGKISLVPTGLEVDLIDAYPRFDNPEACVSYVRAELELTQAKDLFVKSSKR